MSISDLNRILDNLAYLKANPTARYPSGWIAEVEAEARAAGLLNTSPADTSWPICRPGIDAMITYGGDMEDVF